MRHRVYNPKFNRNTNARKGLFRELMRSLFEHGFVVTTQKKAGVIKRIADKLVTNAKKDGLPARRLVAQFFGERGTANTLVDKWVPLLKDRHSGYTTLELQGRRRGDNTMMVKLSLAVAGELPAVTSQTSSDQKTKVNKKSVQDKPEIKEEVSPRLIAPKVVGSRVAKGTLMARPQAAAVKRPQAKG